MKHLSSGAGSLAVMEVTELRALLRGCLRGVAAAVAAEGEASVHLHSSSGSL